jgi:phospholipase/lecithinase/hemolysin
MSLINTASLGLDSVPGFIANGFDDFLSGVRRAFGLHGPAPSPGAPYSNLYAFGDSLSGAGNDYILTLNTLPVSPPYSDGRFSNGPVWVQDLATSLGLPAVSASLGGGTDFAYGAAETGATPLHAETPIDLPSQLAQFRFTNPAPPANALYTLSIGTNDVLDALSAFATDPGTAIADVGDAVANETSFVAHLAGDGAHALTVLNVPDLGKTPYAIGLGAGTAQAASFLSALYDQDLSASLQSVAGVDGLNVHLVDTFALLDAAIANPAAYGLTNVTDPVWTGNYTDPSSGTLRANGAAADSYLYFDSLHPTAHGHAVLASAAQASLG